jgi:hypothetical protein
MGLAREAATGAQALSRAYNASVSKAGCKVYILPSPAYQISTGEVAANHAAKLIGGRAEQSPAQGVDQGNLNHSPDQ